MYPDSVFMTGSTRKTTHSKTVPWYTNTGPHKNEIRREMPERPMVRGTHSPSAKPPHLARAGVLYRRGESPENEQRLPGPAGTHLSMSPCPTRKPMLSSLVVQRPFSCKTQGPDHSVSPGPAGRPRGGPGPTHPFALLGGAVQPRHHLAVQQQEQRLVRHRGGHRPFRAGPDTRGRSRPRPSSTGRAGEALGKGLSG